MIIDATFGLKGRYKAVVRGPDMEFRRESAWSDNVVTDLGVRMLLGGATVNPNETSVQLRCSCGAGNSTPSVSDTQIQSFIAGSGTAMSRKTVRNTTVSPYYVMHQWVWRFGAGVAQGNVSELCVTNGTSSNASSPLFSRALVRDGAGNPTTITIGPDEYLDVTYELYIYPSQTDQVGTFNQTIDGTPVAFSYISRAALMQDGSNPGGTSGWAANTNAGIATIYGQVGGATYSSIHTVGGNLGSVSSRPTGAINGFINQGSSSTANYALKYRDITYTVGLNNANVVFDCVCLAYNLGSVQMKFDPPITKVNTKTYSITIRVTLDNTI